MNIRQSTIILFKTISASAINLVFIVGAIANNNNFRQTIGAIITPDNECNKKLVLYLFFMITRSGTSFILKLIINVSVIDNDNPNMNNVTNASIKYYIKSIF